MLSLSNLNLLSITQTIFFSRSICPYLITHGKKENYLCTYIWESPLGHNSNIYGSNRNAQSYEWKSFNENALQFQHINTHSNKTTKRELVSAFSYVLNLVSFDCVGCQSSSTQLCFPFPFWRTSFPYKFLSLGNWKCCRIFKGQNLAINFKWQSWDQLFLSKCPLVVNKYGIIWSVNWHHRTIPGQNDLKEDQPGRDPR